MITGQDVSDVFQDAEELVKVQHIERAPEVGNTNSDDSINGRAVEKALEKSTGNATLEIASEQIAGKGLYGCKGKFPLEAEEKKVDEPLDISGTFT